MGTNQEITAAFNEPMDPATILAPGTFTVTGPGATPVSGAVTYDAANNIAIFTPTGGTFASSTAFTATLTTAAESSALSPLASNYVWSFTTGASTDTTAPLVSSTNPADATTGVGTNQKIAATFSQAMDSTTLTPTTFTLTAADETPVVGTVTYSTIGTTATFTPNSSLAANTTYTATIAAGVVDLAGNALASNFVWTFTAGATADSAAPTVSSTNPVNGASGVGIDASINATFDETMDTATLSPRTFTLTGPGATVVAGQVTYDVPDMIVTFTPASPLAASTTFTAALTGALDLAGNPLATFVWTFETGTSATGCFIVGISGGSGDKSPTDAGVTSYITEYFSYLSSKYGTGVTEKSYLVDPTGAAQQTGDPNNCGSPIPGYNVNQWIADKVSVIILRPRQADSSAENCTAASTEAALQNTYNEATAAGMTVWVETANPIGSDPTIATIRQAITIYILANFSRTVDMTTGFANGTGSNYTANSAYYVSASSASGAQYNAAGNTLAEQRMQAALGY